ncbi:CATRA system-associated protein [Streptomyces sp. NPDC047071]|uniref:CATRA system-associated protein n=1 Tax=Streptomyces sp. NPDC047071 TaxID=3154808 RepID=UPI003454C71F
MTETAAGNDFGEAARQAASALRRVAAWRMPASRWVAVAAALDAMGQSWRARDSEGLRLATARLALAGPRLVATRHEDDPLVPAPPEVYERSNLLVTEILNRLEAPSPGRGEDGSSGGPSDDASRTSDDEDGEGA